MNEIQAWITILVLVVIGIITFIWGLPNQWYWWRKLRGGSWYLIYDWSDGNYYWERYKYNIIDKHSDYEDHGEIRF